MLLEKLNETVFQLKRKKTKGNFEFRVSLKDEVVQKITFSVVNPTNPALNSHIEMTESELSTVVDSLFKLREIIKYPKTINSSILSVNHAAVPLEEEIVPLSLDGAAPKSKEEVAIKNSLDAIDEGLASLDELDIDPIPVAISFTQSVIEKEIPTPKLVAPKIPITAPAISEDSGDNEDKLDPTEWDPW